MVAVGGIVGGAAAAYLNCFSSTKQVCVGSREDFAVGRMKEVTVPGMDQQIIIIRESQTLFRACGSMCTHARMRTQTTKANKHSNSQTHERARTDRQTE